MKSTAEWLSIQNVDQSVCTDFLHLVDYPSSYDPTQHVILVLKEIKFTTGWLSVQNVDQFVCTGFLHPSKLSAIIILPISLGRQLLCEDSSRPDEIRLNNFYVLLNRQVLSIATCGSEFRRGDSLRLDAELLTTRPPRTSPHCRQELGFFTNVNTNWKSYVG